MQITRAQLDQAMRLLDVTPADIRQARLNGERLEAFKERVKRTYRSLAKQLHPDKTGGDVDKEFVFKLLTQVVAELNKLEVVRVRRPVFLRTPPPPHPSRSVEYVSEPPTSSTWQPVSFSGTMRFHFVIVSGGRGGASSTGSF